MRYLLFSLIFIGIVSCEGQTDQSEKTPIDSGSLMQTDQLDTCQCVALDIDTNGVHLLNNETYTGICIEYYPNTKIKYIEKRLLNGKLHGKLTYFDKNGDVLIERIFENGVKKRSGEVDVLNCKCSELTEQKTHIPQVPLRYLLDDIPYTGTCEQYYPDSQQIYMKRTYVNGIPDGHTIYYNKDGSTLMIEKYEKGMLVTIIN